MSTILRHKPEKFGVRLDANGWTGVEELISALNAHDAPITRADLDRIVATSDKTAAKVGARHGPPAVLLIEAGAMFADGLQFYCADNGVWFTDAVPPKYLRLLQHR